MNHLSHGLDGRGDRAAWVDRADEAAREGRLHNAQHGEPSFKSFLADQGVGENGRAYAAEEQLLENRDAVELADIVQRIARALDGPVDNGAKAMRDRKVEILDACERDRGRAGRRQSRCADEHHLFAPERHVRQGRRVAIIRHDGDVDAAELQPFLKKDAQALRDAEMHIRERLPARLHDGLAETRRQGRRHAEGDVADGMTGGLRDRLADLVDVAQQGLAHLEQGQAGFRRLDPAGRAEKELGAQFLFEDLDLPAQGGLGDVEGLRRPAEIPELGDIDEITNLSDVHGRVRLCWSRHRSTGWPTSLKGEHLGALIRL